MKENCKMQSDEEGCDFIYQLTVSKFTKSTDHGKYQCILKNDTWPLDFATIEVGEILGKMKHFENNFEEKIFPSQN